MATLSTSFDKTSNETAVIVPSSPPLEVSFARLSDEIATFQGKLAKLGISHESAVSIALPNSYEFIVCAFPQRMTASHTSVRRLTTPGFIFSSFLAARVCLETFYPSSQLADLAVASPLP
jgi:hypothetical protein